MVLYDNENVFIMYGNTEVLVEAIKLSVSLLTVRYPQLPYC